MDNGNGQKHIITSIYVYRLSWVKCLDSVVDVPIKKIKKIKSVVYMVGLCVYDDLIMGIGVSRHVVDVPIKQILTKI